LIAGRHLAAAEQYATHCDAMKTIAVDIEDDVYSKAQQKALALETSVPSIVADYLRRWASESEAVDHARCQMTARFAHSNWQFAVGTPDDRTLRNARR
jgi:hypothetical protein